MASAWGDAQVARALGDVVARGGRRALDDPARIEADLAGQLGAVDASLARQIDALVVAVEENVPARMLSGVPAMDLSERLARRGLSPEAAGWVLSTWGRALAEQRWTTPEPEPVTLPRPVAPPPESLPARRAGRRGRILVGVAAGLVVVLAAAAAAIAAFSTSFTAFTADRTDAGGPLTRPALPGGGPTGPTAAAPGARTGGLVVLARAGGSERYPPGTSKAFLDAARMQTPKGLRVGVLAGLRWTRDDVPVLVEDARVGPPMYCPRRYLVANVTWSRLLSSCLTRPAASSDRRSYPVASLNSTLQKLSAVTGAQLFLQLKTVMTARQREILLMQLGQTRMWERVVIGSFRAADLVPLDRGAAPGGVALRLMLISRSADLNGTIARQEGYWAVALPRAELTTLRVQDVHAGGVRVVGWNYRGRAGWAAARAAGVDLVLSSTPRAYLRWLEPS